MFKRIYNSLPYNVIFKCISIIGLCFVLQGGCVEIKKTILCNHQSINNMAVDHKNEISVGASLANKGYEGHLAYGISDDLAVSLNGYLVDGGMITDNDNGYIYDHKQYSSEMALCFTPIHMKHFYLNVYLSGGGGHYQTKYIYADSVGGDEYANIYRIYNQASFGLQFKGLKVGLCFGYGYMFTQGYTDNTRINPVFYDNKPINPFIVFYGASGRLTIGHFSPNWQLGICGTGDLRYVTSVGYFNVGLDFLINTPKKSIKTHPADN